MVNQGDDDPDFPHKSRVRCKRDENLDALKEGTFDKRRPREINANLFDKDEDKELGIPKDPKQFKANMDYFVNTYEIDLRALAKDTRVEYRWLRRIVREGLERKVDRLDRVASYFNLADGDYFWATDIKKFLAPPPPKPDRLISMKQKINWPYAQRLLDLLETGQPDFLRELIDRLYAASSSAPAITPAQERERADPPCHMTDAWRPQESGDE
jgi:hypothetical protein